MTESADCQLIGRWRIIEADLWDRGYLDLVEPAYIAVERGGQGEFAFGVVTASMVDVQYSRRIVYLAWTGSDEGDEISGTGSADLQDDGLIEIELSFHNGDEAVLKAKRE